MQSLLVWTFFFLESFENCGVGNMQISWLWMSFYFLTIFSFTTFFFGKRELYGFWQDWMMMIRYSWINIMKILNKFHGEILFPLDLLKIGFPFLFTLNVACLHHSMMIPFGLQRTSIVHALQDLLLQVASNNKHHRRSSALYTKCQYLSNRFSSHYSSDI